MKVPSLFVSIIAPVYNEEANLDFLFERLTAALKGLSYEIIFVNDGSHDDSLDKIRSLSKLHDHVKYVSFSRNFGHQMAVFAGMQHVSGEYVAIIDADLQDPPELILEMITKAREGYDVVYAKRRTRKGESFFKRITAKLFYRFIKSITSINIPVDTGDFRVMTRRVCRIVSRMPEKNKFLRGQIAWVGFKQTYIEYDRDARHSGASGYPFKKMLDFALDGITAFSNFPIRMVTYVGLIMALVSLIMVLYALVSKFILGSAVPGWTSLVIIFTLIGGTQLFCLGIIGEYISRIFNNVLSRPDYLVEESSFDDGEGQKSHK